MTCFFSPAVGGFFDDALHRDLPLDAIQISAASHRELLEAQAEGKLIAVVAGEVQAIAPPPPSPTDQLAIIRRQRDRLLAVTDKLVAVSDFPITAAQREELLPWREALRDLPSTLDLAAPFDSVIWPARPAWLDESGEIVSASPAG